MVLKFGHFGTLIRNAWKFLNVKLERGLEVHLEGMCEKRRRIAQQKINILHSIKGRYGVMEESLLDW